MNMKGRVTQFVTQSSTVDEFKFSLLDYFFRNLPIVTETNLISPSIYDTAWIARIPQALPSKRRALTYLLTNQHADGSFGCETPYYYDRLLSTLNVVIALAQYQRIVKFHHYSTFHIDAVIEQALEFLEHHLQNYPQPPEEPVGYELLVPTLLIEAENMDLSITFPNKQRLEALYNRKMELISPFLEELLIKRLSPLHYSLEFLGPTPLFDLKEIARKFVDKQGSLASSSTPVAYLMTHNIVLPESKAFIKFLSIKYHGTVPNFYPLFIFEKLWQINHLVETHVPIFSNLATWFRHYIRPYWHPLKGIGISPFFIPDADAIAMALQDALLLNLYSEISFSFKTLERYWREDLGYFVTFSVERHPSITTNLNVVNALLRMRERHGTCHPLLHFEVIDTIIDYIFRQQNPNGMWFDKWHLSPFYPTSRAVLAFRHYNRDLLQKTIDGIIRCQNDDGSFTAYMKDKTETPNHYTNTTKFDETVYALLSLLYYRDLYPKDVPFDVIQHGMAYIEKNLSIDPFGEMWICKVNYNPKAVNMSALLSVISMYHTQLRKI